jgi:hypothetical protein
MKCFIEKALKRKRKKIPKIGIFNGLVCVGGPFLTIGLFEFPEI